MAIKQKHVDAAREARLWIRDILIPVGCIVLCIVASKMSGNKAQAKNNAYEYGKDENGSFIRNCQKPDIIL